MSTTKELPMRITIDLTVREYDRLQQIAKAARRPLRDQAAWIVAEKLKEVPRNETTTR